MNIFTRARNTLAGLARRALNIEPGQYHGQALMSPVLSGVTVTPQSALALTSYYCGVNVISTDVAKLPLNLYRRRRGGGQSIVTTDPRNGIVSRKPNALMTGMRRRQAEMGHVLGWGNAYTQILRDGDGNPTGLLPLHPGTVKPLQDDASKRLFYQDINTGKKYLPEDVLHVAGLGFDGLSGYSPVALARQAIGLGIGVEQFGASLFGNGAVPKGVLRTPKRLSEDAAKRLRETWYNVHGGSLNANRLAVLEEGLEWVNTQINPDDAQFLATRQFQVLEVCRILNLPPHKLGDYTASHDASVEEANLDYLTSNLLGWIEGIEDEYNNKLLFDDEQERLFFEHDLTRLLRGNMAARGGFYKTLFSMGSISPNEIRSREGLNPIKEGGDQYLVQAQYVALEDAGKAMAAKSGNDPNADAKPDPEDPNANEPPKAKPPGKRFNPNHDKAGKFGAGHGSGGGGGHGLSQDEMISRSNEIGESLADHPHPVPEVIKETGVTPPDGWEGEKTSEHAELVKDQAAEVKDLEKDQASEAKAFDREQAAELKAFEREQKAEAKARRREGEDPETIASDQHGERESFLGEQKDALDSFAGDQKDHAASVLSNHRDDRAEMIGGFALDLFETEGQD